MTATNPSVGFFEAQCRKQVAARDFALNPFERACLPFVRGRTLDLGCGLGNLAIGAARRGADVTAVDASESAIERSGRLAADERLPLRAVLADLASYAIPGRFDTIVAIGLLMFFDRGRALALLGDIQEHVADGGTAIVNVLAEGTTYMGMFDPGHYCLFGRDELKTRFHGWNILLDERHEFDAPGGTRKVFSTLVANKPSTRSEP